LTTKVLIANLGPSKAIRITKGETVIVIPWGNYREEYLWDGNEVKIEEMSEKEYTDYLDGLRTS
jgi:hypothetical protein